MALLRRDRLADVLWSLVAVAIVLGGVAGFRAMGALRTPLEAAEIERAVPLVETVPLALHREPVPIRGEGFVTPRRQVSVAAQAAGRVLELNPALVDLGPVGEGEVLVRLDDRSARATLARAEADIDATRARIALNASQLERTETLRRRGVVSQEELDQRLAEEAELAGSLASLESARLGAEIALENTLVLAPFDGVVRSRAVELGGVVTAGQPLAELFTADALEVVVPLTERAASLVPGLFGAGAGGAGATVTTTFAGRERAHPARVVRAGRALGAGTRMLDVTVALEPDDTGEASADGEGGAPPAGRAPALVDGYARVAIDGATLEETYAVPSAAVRPEGVVWLVAGDRFAVRPATIVHVDGATSYVRIAERPAEAALVTGVVDTPLDGMRVQSRAATEGARPAPDDPGALDAAALAD